MGPRLSTNASSPSNSRASAGWDAPRVIETVRDMEVGETRRAHVSADEATEERTDARILEVERAKIPADVRLVVGEMVNLEQPDGQTFPRAYRARRRASRIDMNHDAICKALNFEITLLDVYDLPDRRRI